MGIRNKLKRVLSFLCVVSIVVSSLCIVPEAQAEANNSLDRITLSDMGFSGEETIHSGVASEDTKRGIVGSFVGKEIVFYATFGNYRYFSFGNQGEVYQGVVARLQPNGTDFKFYHDKDTSNAKTVTYTAAEHFGAGTDKKFEGQKLLFRITVEYADASQENIKINFYIDNKHAAEMVIEKAWLGNDRFSFGATSTATITTEDCVEEPNTSLDRITLSDMGFSGEETIHSGVASEDTKRGIVGSFVGKEIVFYATFGNYRYFSFGNQGEVYQGVVARLQPNGTDFKFYHDKDTSNAKTVTYTAAEHFGAGTDKKFEGQKLLFRITVEYADASQENIKINFYIDNKHAAEMVIEKAWLGNDRFSFGATSTATITTEDFVQREEVELAPDNLTSLTWENFGISEKVYSDAGTTLDKTGVCSTITNIKNTSFRGKLKFSTTDPDSTILYYGDNRNGYQNGINFRVLSDGTLKVRGGGKDIAILNPTTAGLQSNTFLNTEFELGIDLWIDNADLKLILYIDGNQYNKTAYVWENGASYEHLYNAISLQVGAGSSIEVVYPKEEIELAPDNLTSVTWENFGISGKVYSDAGTTLDKTGVCSTITNIKNTSFRGKLKISTTTTDSTILYYGDNRNGYQNGINFRVLNDGTLKVRGGGKDIAILNPTTAGLQSNTFLNTEFELGIDLWIDNADLKLILYIDGNQYNKTAYVWENGASYEHLYNAISLQVGAGSNIEVICPQEEPELSPDNLTAITWKTFGMTETKNYTKAMGDEAGFTGTQASEMSSILGTSFRGKVKFIKPNIDKSLFICYGATSKWNWDGVLIIPQADGTLQLKAAGVVLGTVEPIKAGIISGSFINTEFELGIDMWQAENDVKFNVFINGNQYNTKAYTWGNAAADNKIGKACNFLVGADDYVISAILPEPVGEASPEGLTPITWASFGISSGTVYTKESGDADGFLGTSATGLSSMLGTSFRGEIIFDKQSTDNSMLICYGATSKWAWDGLLLVPQSDGSLQVKAAVGGTVLATLEPSQANLSSFLDSQFELGIDIWESGNDAKVNIFINGVQYRNRTFLWKDAVASNLIGKACNFRVGKDTDSITVNSVKLDYGPTIEPEKNLKKISFSSFGIADGVYGENKNALAVSGGYFDPVRGRSLNGTLFSGYVKFGSQNGAQFNYGGKNSAWEGIAIRSMGDALWLVQGDNLLGTFMPDIAGVQLTDNMINLKLSIVFVDSDKDGDKDDVQLGVWFNDRMYKNEYYYLTDFASQMGSLLGIYSPTKGLNVEVKTEEVDNSADLSLFGFDKDWKTFLTTTGKPRSVYTSLDNVGKVNRVASDESPKTSDCSPIGVFNLLLAASALAVVIIEKKRYTKKEV